MPFLGDFVFDAPGADGVEDGADDEREEGCGCGDRDTRVINEPVPDEPGGFMYGFVGDVDFGACDDGLVETVFGRGCGTHVKEGDDCVAGEVFGTW